MIPLLFASALLLADVTPEPSPAAPVRHLEYRFGWNAKVADAGPHTGTLKLELTAPAPDGSVTVTSTELWWNALRPTETDTCQIYPNGGITCLQRPYFLSATELTLFPLLASNYFDGLNVVGVPIWNKAFALRKGVGVWDCDFTLNGKGPVPGSPQVELVEATGVIKPHDDRSREETVSITTRIAYDPIAKLPVLVEQEMVHNQRQPLDLESVQLKLTKVSP